MPCWEISATSINHVYNCISVMCNDIFLTQKNQNATLQDSRKFRFLARNDEAQLSNDVVGIK